MYNPLPSISLLSPSYADDISGALWFYGNGFYSSYFPPISRLFLAQCSPYSQALSWISEGYGVISEGWGSGRGSGLEEGIGVKLPVISKGPGVISALWRQFGSIRRNCVDLDAVRKISALFSLRCFSYFRADFGGTHPLCYLRPALGLKMMATDSCKLF